ncbi:putative prolyl 4-hydroxylase 7 [Nymphaea thermarum]|nr:putative prolyl 4-hydroxylase 7 [Nymphaea thermarum]
MSFLPLFLLLLLSLVHISHSSIRLPELYRSFRLRSDRPTNEGHSGSSSGFDPTRVTQLSWHPRAFLYKGFLSDEECDHLIKLTRGKLQKSMVADNVSGKSMQSQVRTSSGYFLKKGQDSVVRRIENRISRWTFLPKENGESIHVLHYGPGQKYEPHFDYFNDKYNIALGGHRMATVLMYLADVKLGGETVFPSVEPSAQNKEDPLSKCGKSGFAGL